jgi:tetratricopeptide (TPR) repeat protein
MDDEVQTSWVIDPEVKEAIRFDKVRAALDAGRFDEAVVELEELLDDEPDHLTALVLLASATLDGGDPEGAVALYDQVLARDDLPEEERDDALLGLAAARYRSADPHGARTAAQSVLARSSQSADGQYLLGLAASFLEGAEAESAQAFVAAQRLDPDEFPAALTLSESEWKRLFGVALRQAPLEVRTFWQSIPVRFVARPALAWLRSFRPPLDPSLRGVALGEPEDDERPEALQLHTDNLARLGDRDAIVEALVEILEDEASAWQGADGPEPADD